MKIEGKFRKVLDKLSKFRFGIDFDTLYNIVDENEKQKQLQKQLNEKK